MTTAYEEYVNKVAESMSKMEEQLKNAAAAEPNGMQEIACRLMKEIMPASENKITRCG